MCIGMYYMYWYVLVCIVCNGLYWYAFACIEANCTYWWVLVGTWLYLCVLVLTDFQRVCCHIDEYWLVLDCICVYQYVLTLYWCVLPCIVSIRGVCKGFVSVSQYFMHWPALPKQYVQLAHIDSIFMYLLVLMCVLVYLYVACIIMYRVNWPVAPTVCIFLCLLVLTWRYLHILVCLMCIDLYCTLWFVFI